MKQKSYSEKLKDPRWQRKRLEIMQRDKFACKNCGIDTKTLNVHHLEYRGEPWECPNLLLITLCEDCHNRESELRAEQEAELLQLLRLNHLCVDDLHSMVELIAHYPFNSDIINLLWFILARDDVKAELTLQMNALPCPF